MDDVSVSCSISSDEIVAPGTQIQLTLEAPVDPQAVQASIRLMRGCSVIPVGVTLAKRGRAVDIQLPQDEIGAFDLIVSELVSIRGKRLAHDYRLRFSVMPISGTVSRELRIEHAVRLSVGDLQVKRLLPGQKSDRGHVDVLKVVHRKTGVASELAFDQNGKRVDIEKQLAELAKRRAEKYGRIHETLYARMENAKANEKLPIVVWPRINLPPAPYEKSPERRALEPPAGEQKVASALRKATTGLASTLARYDRSVKAKAKQMDPGVPCLSMSATPAQIRELAAEKTVGAIWFEDRTAVLDLNDSIAIARSGSAHAAGFDGTGIRVAVWEDGPSVTTNLTFAGRFTTTPPASNHARLTSAIVKNTEANRPHGHAPDCDLYSANTFSNDALRWAIRDQHCTVVSQSFHRNTEPGGATLQADDLLKDWLALRWPYPTIVQAAGNFWLGDADNITPPQDEFVNHKGYNSLAIGNHDDTAAAMSGDSVFRNPTTTHGDRELPELAANGTGVSANGQTMSGTSFAAPATAGVTALLQDVDNVLCSWPEGCRAILLAAAGRNVQGNTWWQDVINGVDGRDGAGAVDARAGVTIAQQRRWRDAPATRHGWDVGTLSSSVVGSDRLATFRYRVVVPSRLLLLPRVKVALAWDSAVTSSGDNPTASTLTVDMDLLVKDSSGTIVASAASWDNSYEVAEFAARPGETYEIIIRRWSGTDSVWYGVAWTVTGLSLFSVLEPATVLREG